ncbi:MAG TPA: hypothetical protein VFM80_12030 [Gracilimonas sp.]|uniref:hypothetical protein n=1 Tax=Gracilimonas sp. TaxID=1974203 RepID=UPI002DA0780E|nr:hypothetical protein [Gracilimonas sp.]
MKQTLALISGFLGLLFFEGFARLIITFYHRIEFHFYGISHFPSDVWIYVIFVSVITSTWLTSMLILTVLKTNSKRYALLFAGMIILWRGVEIANSYQSEPIYYFVGVNGLHLLGVYLAYVAYSRQKGIN